MKELMTSPYFGVGLSVVAFWIGEKLHIKDTDLQPADCCDCINCRSPFDF
jgi:hypothetical protein